MDQYGYKYKAQLHNLNTYNKLPHKFRSNPFVLYNINKYLEIVNSPLVLESTEYVDCKHKLKFRCKIHDTEIQERTLNDLLAQNGRCKFCTLLQKGKKYQVDTNVIVHKCQLLDLNYVDRFIKDQGTYVKFTCKKHLNKGVQIIAWDHLRTSSKGCPYCSGRYKTDEEFIDEIALIDPDIKILGSYEGSEKPILCACKICGHKWSPLARSLKNGQGCPGCIMSKGERKIKRYLENKCINYIYQKSFDDCRNVEKMFFDFYVPEYNTLIEYDGQQHFFPVDFGNKGKQYALEQYKRNKKRDQIKTKYCNEKDIKLIRIPYYNFDKVELILEEKLK